MSNKTEDYIKRLKEYVKDDEIYKLHKEGILNNPDDFEQFCIDHCIDIEVLISEYEELKNKYER